MKRKRILVIAIMVAGVAVVMNGCKKDDSTSGGGGTKTEMLTGTWTATNLITDGYSTWAFLEACSKDAVFTFWADGTAVFDEGATKCDPSDPQTEASTWKFIDSETKFVWDGDTFNIKELTSSVLKLEEVLPEEVSEIHFKKQ